MDLRFEQSLNVSESTHLILFGKDISQSFLQLWNASNPRLTIPSSKESDFREMQFSNEHKEIYFTD